RDSDGDVKRRAIALVTSMLVLACGVLALRHQATVVHVHDVSGAEVHASTVDCHDSTRPTHVHEAPEQPAHDAGACALTGVLHGNPAAITEHRELAVLPVVETSPAIAIVHFRQASLLRAAPKTSPPHA
ncbi:MAG: hypothetical protein ABI867_30845, partial [Kofleriaceae bacterium]